MSSGTRFVKGSRPDISLSDSFWSHPERAWLKVPKRNFFDLIVFRCNPERGLSKVPKPDLFVLIVVWCHPEPATGEGPAFPLIEKINPLTTFFP
jgi:hypothetical protein